MYVAIKVITYKIVLQPHEIIIAKKDTFKCMRYSAVKKVKDASLFSIIAKFQVHFKT